MTKYKKIKFKSLIQITQKNFSQIKKKGSTYQILNQKVSVKIDSQDLKNRINFLLSTMSDFSTQLTIRICDIEEMQNFNSYYRNKNYPTDVLSFPNKEMSLNNSEFSYLGDILICFPVCYKQAKNARSTISQELEKMIIHGIVHLKGFDHERSNSSWSIMTNLEKNLRKELHKEMGQPKWCNIVPLCK
jgi:probable rRNA maturation factor